MQIELYSHSCLREMTVFCRRAVNCDAEQRVQLLELTETMLNIRKVVYSPGYYNP